MNRGFARAAFVCAALFCTASMAVEVRPQRIDGIAPLFDKNAESDLKEGWVIYELNISEAGDVDDARILTSYPSNVFDDEMIRAVKTWKFKPKLVDGVPTREPSYRGSFAFSIETLRGISLRYIGDFRAAQRHLYDKNLEKAEVHLSKLREGYEQKKLNLSELARYFQFEALFAITKQDYIKAAEFTDRALNLAQFHDTKSVVDGLHQQYISAFVGLGQYNNAIDYYDSWRKETSIEVSEKFATAMDDLRKAGYGRGRAFDIRTYKEAREKSKKTRYQPGRKMKPTEPDEDATSAPSPSAPP